MCLTIIENNDNNVPLCKFFENVTLPREAVALGHALVDVSRTTTAYHTIHTYAGQRANVCMDLPRSNWGYRRAHDNIQEHRMIPCNRIPEHGSIFRQIIDTVSLADLLSVLHPANKHYLIKKYGHENIERWLTGRCNSEWETRWIDEVLKSMVLVVDEGQKRVTAFSTMLVEDMQMNIGEPVHRTKIKALAWHQPNTHGRTEIMHRALRRGRTGRQVILVAFAEDVGKRVGLFDRDTSKGTHYVPATAMMEKLNK